MTAVLPRRTRSTTPVLSGFRVDRVAGLSATAPDLDATGTDLLFAELDQVDRDVQALSGAVSDLLYQLVPLLDDDVATRRVVLEVRRSCGGGGTRFPHRTKAGTVSAAVAARLGAEAGRLFDRWYETRSRREQLLADLEDSYAGDVERSQESLRQVLAHEDFATGVAQANPIMAQSMHELDLRPGRRDARSLGGYVSRAARKTSPFSLLTAVSSTADRDGAPREVLTVSQGHVVAWLEALAAREELIGAFELEPLWTPGRNPITDSIVMPEVTRIGGYTWRQDRSLHLAEWGEVLGRLQYLGRRPAAIYLAAVGGDDAFATLRRLIEVGVVRVVAPWGYGEADRLTALARAVRAHDDPAAAGVADLLTELSARVQGLAGLRGQARARALVALQRHVERLLAGYGVCAADADFTVYSDARPLMRVGELGGHVRDDLVSLGEAVRPLVFRSHLYDLIMTRFTARYGVGGSCADLFGFLSTVADDDDGLQGMFRAAAQDAAGRSHPGERAWLPVGDSSAPPTTAVLYQVAGADLAAVRDGDFALVVNQLHTGTGSLVSRFHGPDGGGLREALRDWASRLYPDVTVLEFIASAASTTCSRPARAPFHGCAGPPSCRWPGIPTVPWICCRYSCVTTLTGTCSSSSPPPAIRWRRCTWGWYPPTCWVGPSGCCRCCPTPGSTGPPPFCAPCRLRTPPGPPGSHAPSTAGSSPSGRAGRCGPTSCPARSTPNRRRDTFAG